MRKMEKVLNGRVARQVGGLSKVKAKKLHNRLTVDASLRVRLHYNPVEPLSEEEFPAQFR